MRNCYTFSIFEAAPIKLIVQISVLALLFWLEALIPFFKPRPHRYQHAIRNLGMGLINGLLIALFFSGVTLVVINASHQHVTGLLPHFKLASWQAALIALVLFDLWMYAWHVLNHRIPLLWRFHRMHHSDSALDATSALRFHTGEIILSAILRLPILIILGMSLEQLLIYEAVLQPIILLHHSNVRIPEAFDRVLRLIIVTPHMHWIHHSQEPHETNSNYSSIFSCWDRLGRTFRQRSDFVSLRYGLTDFSAPRWQTFTGMLLTPLPSQRSRSERTGNK